MRKLQNSKSGFTAVEVVIIVVILGLIGFVSWRVYDSRSKSTNSQASTNQTEATPKASEPSTTEAKTANTVHTDKATGLTFELPSGWSVAADVPAKFKTKMFEASCSGPILVKAGDDNVLIASEVKPVNGDGGFCWSTGDTSQGENKWTSLTTNKWVGDFLLMSSKNVSSDRYRAFFVLVNYETSTLRGETDLNTVANSAKF